jgi:hypothetical protein
MDTVFLVMFPGAGSAFRIGLDSCVFRVLICMFCQFKDSVQRKLRWVESGVNGYSVADPGSLSRIRIFFPSRILDPSKKKSMEGIDRLSYLFWLKNI